jgi:hypothetical protein
MIARRCVPLGILLILAGPATAKTLSKSTVDMQSVAVPLHTQASPNLKASPPNGPRLTIDAFISQKRTFIHDLEGQQIRYLQRIIELASPDDPQLPDYLFRLGELFAEKYRYWNGQARRLDEKIFQAEHGDNPDPASEPSRAQ